ncbi:fimbrial protein [Enterobacter wuhouensis]
MTFSGTADADNADLLALSDTSGAGGMASGVGIEILDPNKKPVALNSLSDEIPLTAGDNALTFYLRYKATQIPVSPGNASSIMYFDLVYQ